MSTGPRLLCLGRGVVVFVLGLLFTLPVLAQKPALGDPDAPQTGPKTSSSYHDDPAARMRWFMQGRTVKGENSGALLRRAYKQRQKLRDRMLQRLLQTQSSTTQATTSTTSTSAGGGAPMTAAPIAQTPWTNLGPAPIFGMGSYGNASGRIVAIAVDQCDTTGNTVIVTGAYGGAWRSTNAAAANPTTVTWTPLYDNDPAATTLATGAVSLQSGNCGGSTSNVILVGTGEPNNAGDSYYGQGILRSGDGGTTWTMITSGDGGTNPFFGMGVSKFAWNPNGSVVVAGFSNGTLGFGSGGLGIPNANDQGIYYSTDTGATWHKATNTGDNGFFGSITDVVWNAGLSKFFAVAKKQGVYSSSDGINWTRLATQPYNLSGCSAGPAPTCNIYRGQLTVLPGAADMYIWAVDNNSLGTTNLGVAKTTNGGASWSMLSSSGLSSCGDSQGCFNNSGDQGFYDLYLAAVPNGTATDLYAGAVNLWKCTIPAGQSGTLCGSATSGSTSATNAWMNVTHVYGNCGPSWTNIHPDNHAIDFIQVGPNANQIVYFGNDGGAYRTLNSPGVNTGICSSGSGNPFDDLNTSTLGSLSQFVFISQDPADSSIILGGTQDNGSPGIASILQTSSLVIDPPGWYEAWNGDGGFNQIDQTNPQNWYVTNTDVSIWKCSGGTDCLEVLPFCDTSTSTSCVPAVSNAQVGNDHGAFYTPFILDPANQAIGIVGTCRVWRGAITRPPTNLTHLSNNFDFGNSSLCSQSNNMISFLAAGGTPVSGVSPVIYAGRANGDLWVTTNANLGASSTWTQAISTFSPVNPGNFTISYIAIDPADATGHTAYVAIMGFTGNPNGAGHLFKTTNAGGTWTDVGIGLPDSPADAIAIDPRDHNIVYVGTDVGVFITMDGGTTWQEYGTGLPNVAVVALQIFNSGGVQRIRVGTHGRGVWENTLVSTADYQINVNNSSLTVYPSVNAAFTGTLVAGGSYNSPVALSCDAGGGSVPGTCAPAASPVTPTGGGAAFTVNASNATPADFSFNIKGVGSDVDTTTHTSPVALHVIDFALGSNPGFTVPRGTNNSGNLALTVSGNWPNNRFVNASCSIQGAPITGMDCQVDPGASGSNTNFVLTVFTSGTTPAATYNVTVTGTDSVDGTTTRSQVVPVTVQTNPHYELATTVNPPTPAWPGQSIQGTAQMTFFDGYNPATKPAGTVNFTCGVFDAIDKTPVAHPTCAVSPLSSSTNGQNITVTINTTSAVAADYGVEVDGSDGTGPLVGAVLGVNVIDYTATIPATANVLTGATTNLNLIFTPLNGTESVTATCDATAINAGATCTINGGNPIALSSGAANVTMAVTIPGGVASGTTGTITVSTHDTNHSATTHNGNVNATVQDFSLSQGATTANAIVPGQTTANYNGNLVPGAGFSSNVTLSCIGLPAGASCSFPVNPVSGATAFTFTVNTTAGTTPTGNHSFQVQGTFSGVTKSSANYTLTAYNYGIAASPNTTVNVVRGNSANFTITDTPVNGYPAAATLSCSVLPAGVTCPAFTPNPVAAGSTSTLTVATTTAAAIGANGVTVQGSANAGAGAVLRTTGLSLNLQDFSLGISPTSRTIGTGTGAGTTYTVTVTGQGGYTGLVTLSCNAPPANTACSFSPAAVNASPGGTISTLTVITTGSLTGSHPISVQGTGDGQTRSAPNANLSVSSAASFALSMTTTTKTVTAGSSTTYSILVKATSTVSPGAVTMSCVPPLPTGVTCGFSPNGFTPTTTGMTVTATVNTTSATPAGNQTITFQGATASQFKRINGTLQVQDFTLGVNPTSVLNAVPGSSAQYTVTLTSVNGFGTAANLSCTGLPAGWSCGFAPSLVTPTAAGANSTLTLTTTSSPFGLTSFNVQATAGSVTRTQQVSVSNGANDYQIALASGNALVAVRPGQTANWSLQLSRFGTFSASVAESCVYTSTTPAGVACNIVPNPADLTTGTCPANGACQTPTLAIPTTAGTTAVGDYPLNFHGNGGASQHDLPLTLRVNDFNISSAATPQTVEQAGSATYNVTVTSLNNYGGTVALSCANFTSSGMSCGFSPNNFVPAAAGTPVTVTLNAAANATPASNQTFDVVAGDGATSHSVSLGYSTIQVQDFAYTNSTTATQTVLPGQAANYSTTLTPLNSFSASVTLTCSGLPANTTCSFSPNSPVAISGGTPKPVTVTLNTTSTTPAGNATITVTAHDLVSGKTHAINNLSLAVQSFTLSATPTSRTIRPGVGTTFTVTVIAQNGLTQPVTLSCPAAPVGLTCVPPAPITPGSSGTMTVMTAASTTTGTKTLTISGTTGAGGPIVNQNVSVIISTTAPSFNITDFAPTKSVTAGAAVNYSLVVSAASTLSPGAVTMSCVPPLPTGVTCTFSPTTFTPTTTGTRVTATVHTTSATPAQSFALLFQGTTSTQFKTSPFTLNVGDFALDVNPATRTISSASGGSTQYTVTLTSLGSFSTAASLSCTGLPAGWSCGFSPASVTPTAAGATSTLTLTTTSSPLGPTNFNVQASAGGVVHTQQVQVIQGQDFSLSAGGPITVPPGGSNTTQVNATAVGSFSSTIALSCPGLQAGFSCGFNPASITAGTPSTLTINASGAVAGGQYSIAVQGQSSSPVLTHTTSVTVNVPDFSVGLTGNANVVIRGGSLPLSGTATALGGFSTSTTFTCSTGDANAPCVASSPVTPTVGGAAITVTVSPNTSATLGAHTVTLTGNDGAGHVHSATFGITVEDFSVGATDANLSVEAGGTTASYSGTVTGQGGFTGNVTMSCTSTITLTCSFTPNPVAASGAGTADSFTITPDSGAPIGGPYAVTVKGTDASGATRTATVHVSVTAAQDWSYTYQVGTPQTQTVNAGQSANYNINLSPNNGFASQVALTCSVTGAPSGVGCGITGSPLTPPGTITLTVNTTSGTVAAGTYSIVVSGTGGGKTRTTTATLNVKDFTLSAGPSPQTVAPGDTADYTLSITSASFPASPTLSCQILTAPAGSGCSFDSTSVAPGGSTLMHVTSTASTPSGSYTVQVTATSGSTVHTVNVTYTVQSANDFTITTSTPSNTVIAGHSTAYSVTVTATGSFASSVSLSCSNLPAGANCIVGTSFYPSTSGTVRNVTLFTSSSAAKGTFQFDINATGGGFTHSVQVQVTIQ